MNREIRNAVIVSAELLVEDHGLLTCLVALKYGQSGAQSFGGFNLGSPDKKRLPEMGRSCGIWVASILRVAGVSSWGELRGKPLHADADGGRIYRIGHFTEDDWFDPEFELKRLAGQETRTENTGS